MTADGPRGGGTVPPRDGLRGRAEEVVAAKPDLPAGPLSYEDALALVHELQVHQVELALQNEELRRTRLDAEALRDQYIDLYEFAPVGYFTLDRNGTILAANLTGSVLLSQDRRALAGTRLQRFMHPDGLGAFAGFLDRVLHTETTETFEAPMAGGPGQEPWFAQLNGRTEPGGPAGSSRIRVALTDITERKEAERALSLSAEELRRSNEDLLRFAYVASHDLQEPLRSIVSFSQLLERKYKGRLDADADEFIEFIVEGGNRMQGLILDLLAFSRVNTTRQQIARTDTEDVLAEAVRTLDASLREADAALTHDPLPVVMADPLQLAQVFSNLISNAVKFRRPDVPLRVHVGVRRADGFCEFSVSDNGIGIAPEYLDQIFVIFQRLHTKETYPGTGIGLAIVKRIVERHGGRIRVESTPGEGSTFFFTLPSS
ncbi:MAG: ATP-binding protein [Methanospirillum sp.]